MAGCACSASLYPLCSDMIVYAFMRFISFCLCVCVIGHLIGDHSRPSQADWEQEELIRRCDTGRNGLSETKSIR